MCQVLFTPTNDPVHPFIMMLVETLQEPLMKLNAVTGNQNRQILNSVTLHQVEVLTDYPKLIAFMGFESYNGKPLLDIHGLLWNNRPFLKTIKIQPIHLPMADASHHHSLGLVRVTNNLLGFQYAWITFEKPGRVIISFYAAI